MSNNADELKQKLVVLCLELDEELEGYPIPASASSVLHTMREVLRDLELSDGQEAQ